jgi:hypothetical protein
MVGFPPAVGLTNVELRLQFLNLPTYLTEFIHQVQDWMVVGQHPPQAGRACSCGLRAPLSVPGSHRRPSEPVHWSVSCQWCVHPLGPQRLIGKPGADHVGTPARSPAQWCRCHRGGRPRPCAAAAKHRECRRRHGPGRRRGRRRDRPAASRGPGAAQGHAHELPGGGLVAADHAAKADVDRRVRPLAHPVQSGEDWSTAAPGRPLLTGRGDHPPFWQPPARSMVWPTSPGAMACSWRVSCPWTLRWGPEASSIRRASSSGTTVGLTKAELCLQC